ncbi:MAG: phospholipase D-like domain-containing protein, partial [Chloroflexota bacterium]|nr:phospholipase D-like domain-containing protein [Chloroflexota bacterium]
MVGILLALWSVGQGSRDTGIERPGPLTALTVTPGPLPTPTPRPARATEPTAPQPGVVGLFVEPDDGRAPILDELNAARRSIDLEIYLLSDEEILQALERAQARGVRVRVILEEHPFGGAGGEERVFARLEQAGIAVRWSNPAFRLSHIKTFVIDAEVAIIMNLNLTKTSFTGNREFGAITTRPAEVAQADAIFEADWQRSAEPPDGPLVVSPTTSRRTLLGLIESATT